MNIKKLFLILLSNLAVIYNINSAPLAAIVVVQNVIDGINIGNIFLNLGLPELPDPFESTFDFVFEDVLGVGNFDNLVNKPLIDPIVEPILDAIQPVLGPALLPLLRSAEVLRGAVDDIVGIKTKVQVPPPIIIGKFNEEAARKMAPKNIDPDVWVAIARENHEKAVKKAEEFNKNRYKEAAAKQAAQDNTIFGSLDYIAGGVVNGADAILTKGIAQSIVNLSDVGIGGLNDIPKIIDKDIPNVVIGGGKDIANTATGIPAFFTKDIPTAITKDIPNEIGGAFDVIGGGISDVGDAVSDISPI